MSVDRRPGRPLVLTVLLAAGLWYFSFQTSLSIFWLKIAFSASLLAGLAAWLQPSGEAALRWDGRSVILGVVSAGALYLLFWLGQVLSTRLFAFAPDQIGGIYGLGSGFPKWLIALILLFITGPAEEIYWRGYLQRQLALRLGPAQGFIVATALYAGVHLWTLNLMLVGAAAVAGLFWGLMYWKFDNLTANIVSHSLWSAVIFAVLPLH